MENSIEIYSWWGKKNEPPENLRTKKQLSEMGLKPGNPVGVIRGRKYDVYLYDPNNPESAIPKKPATPKQLEALAKGRDSQQFEAAYKEWYSENGRRYRDRNRSIRWAKNILDNADNWLILDTETTGISKAEIVQIGILDLSGNVILDRLIKPTISIPSEASNIHGISDSDVQNAPSFPLIYPEIKSILVNHSIIIYNARFDLSILDYCCELHGLPLLDIRQKSHCLMIEYARYFGRWSNRDKDYIYQPLAGGNHTAIGDCQAALKLLEQMAESEIIDTTKKGFREKSEWS